MVHDHEEPPAAPAGSINGAAPGPRSRHAAGSCGPGPDPGPGSRAPPPRLSFYLDGAHTEESMATCADWFADAVAKPSDGPGAGCGGNGSPAADGQAGATGGSAGGAACPDVQRVLLFNCMPVRPVRLAALWLASHFRETPVGTAGGLYIIRLGCWSSCMMRSV